MLAAILGAARANIPATILGGVAAALLGVCAVQVVQIYGFFWIDGLNDRIDRLKIDNNELRAELKSISDKRNEQATRTTGNIRQAETIRDEAERVAREIEAAPVSGDCRTPEEVMRADV